jgi:transglutaminase-like putative cysteine protease
MRIRISHEASFDYAPPARSVIQLLRLTPRSFEAQHVLRWRVSSDADGMLRQSEDSLGNVTHTFSHQGPIERVRIFADGEVETFDAVGVVRGAVEPLPVEIYLRDSQLAEANGALREFAREAVGENAAPLQRLHPLMAAIHSAMVFEPTAGSASVSAAEAFALRRGGAADFAHIFIACARWLSIPSRYVCGYRLAEEGADDPGHAWAEAYIPDLGWVAFDASSDRCADDRYVRVAVGFDSLGAAPVRSARSGFGEETLSIKVSAKPVSGAGQRQRQG